MALAYHAVDWNRQKRRYDLTLGALLTLSLGTFLGVSLWVSPYFTAETLIIRGTAIAALLLLHVILCVGPLARLDPRFLPLLYNRRHLGVTMFLLALVHGVFAIIQFHALGDENPLVSVFTAYQRDYRVFADGRVNVAHFPFEPFGVVALVILFLLAATSHDFWLRQLGASFWKTLHLGVYAAYGLLLVHVAFGALQSERSVVYPTLLALGFGVVAGLHLAAARQEARRDRTEGAAERDGYVAVGPADVVDEGRGQVVVVGGERVALFRHQGRVFATSNVCRHQGGPVGEGRIVDGCITCPWHGWNYRPEDGCSPPPFQEVLATYDTKLVNGQVWVKRQPNPLGIRGAGAAVPEPRSRDMNDEFYIGYAPRGPSKLARHTRVMVLVLGLLAVLTAALLAARQTPAEPGTFEFGITHTFEGVLYDTPLPLLRTVSPAGAVTNYLLVGAGKHGLPAYARGHDGERIRFQGSLVRRGTAVMIEVNQPASFEALGRPFAAEPPARFETVGEVVLTGELVDTKCWYGVMRPATGKVHRACAVRCLSGGVPPGILLRDGEGNGVVVLLTGDAATPLQFDPQWAARIVTAGGTLEYRDELPVLRVRNLALDQSPR